MFAILFSLFPSKVVKPKNLKEEEDEKNGEFSCLEKNKEQEKTCQCDQCGKAFPFISHLIRHQAVHMKERPFKCKECPKAFHLETDLNNHMKLHSGEQIQCEFCEQMFIGKFNYKKHVNMKHRYNSECEVCKRQFSSRAYLKLHMRTHTNEKPFVCSECGLSYYAISSLNNHKRIIHTDFKQERKRNHVCHLCGKGFFEKKDLKVHSLSHIEVRNHLCTKCGSGFKSSDKLKIHMERHNMPNVPCPHCNLLFTCRINMQKHVRRRHKHAAKAQNIVKVT